jgi:hypothetical protein
MSSSDFVNKANNDAPVIYIGETFIDGQQRDVWCDSKIPITDMRMHWGGSLYRQGNEIFTKAACYVAFHNNVQGGLRLFGDTCLLNVKHNLHGIMFLCE